MSCAAAFIAWVGKTEKGVADWVYCYIGRTWQIKFIWAVQKLVMVSGENQTKHKMFHKQSDRGEPIARVQGQTDSRS